MTLSGVLNVYKEKDMTSFDVVSILRKVSKQKKIGHSGTLDPMARGVLPICLGKATRIAEYISDQGKEYQAVMRFGISTDTLDKEGKVLHRSDKENFTIEEVDQAMETFRGPILQKPPMYSAVKVHGKKLYDYAREGKKVERKARPVEINLLEAQKIDGPFLSFRCQCSKGTYIRKLAEDLAHELGTIGCLWALERTRVGPFSKDKAVSINEIKEMTKDQLSNLIIPMEEALTQFPSIKLKGENARSASHGRPIAWDQAWESQEKSEKLYKVFTEQGFLGLGAKENGFLKMKKVLANLEG